MKLENRSSSVQFALHASIALQIPSLLDLSVDDVSGTCTDTILVVSPELSQAVTRSTMQAGKRPRSAMQGLSFPQSSQHFTVNQVSVVFLSIGPCIKLSEFCA